MMKKFKKVMAIFSLFVFLIYIAPIKIMAATISLPYWYSDSTRESMTIGHWNKFPSKVYVYTFSGMPENFTAAMKVAISNWNSALGISLTYTANTAESTAIVSTVKFFGGTADEIKNLGFWSDDITYYAGLDGLCTPLWYKDTANSYSYNGETVTGMTMSSATGFILDLVDNGSYTIDGNKVTSSNSYIAYANVCTHELGHGLGWYGHNFHTGHVMYSNNEGIQKLSTLSSEDILHIKQLYSN